MVCSNIWLYSVMAGRMDGCLDMFDYAGKLCKEIKAHYRPISTIYCFSGYLVTGSFDGIVKVRISVGEAWLVNMCCFC